MIKTQKELHENLKKIRDKEPLVKDLEEIFKILDKQFSDKQTTKEG